MFRDRDQSDSITIPEPIRGSTVLVTGGAGFVGSHLAHALADACTVRVVDDLSGGDRTCVPREATFLEGDLRDTAVLAPAVEGVDYIFHQAGLVSVPESVERPIESHERNVDATLAVLEAAREQDARVVAASSAAVYGPPSSVPIGEADSTDPTSPYGVDKLAADHYTRLYHGRYGVETVALRYFNVYGPGQDSGVVSAFLDQLRAGEPIIVEGDGEQTRDFVHVADVVRANLAAATTDALGRAYNVGTGEATRIDELAATISQLAGGEVAIEHTVPRPDDLEDSCANIARAKTALGFEPTVALEDGLADLLAVNTPRQ